MTSMEDLISSLTGGMHVSQEGYDIRALQEYLRATLPIPNGPRYPTANHPFKPAPSRAPSATRKPQGLSVPHDAVMGGGAGGQPMPAPMLFSLSESMYGGDVSGMPLTTPVEEMYEQARPANLRRASSYGVAAGPSGMPVTPPQPPLHDAYAYEHDAFAPLIQQQAPLADPWARFRQASQQAAGGNAVAGPSSSGSAFGGHFTHRTPPSGEQRLEAPATYNGEYNNADGDDYDMMEEDEAEAWLGEADEPHHDTGLRLGLGGIASEHDRRASYSSQQLDMHSTGWRHMPGVEVAQRPVSEPGFSWDRGRRQF